MAIAMIHDEAPAKVAIVLADDHQVVRSGLRLLLQAEPGFHVVGEAGDTDSALRMTAARRPDVVVLDLSMPGRSSLAAIPEFAELCDRTRVVVLTMHADPVFARRALQAGASGYVLKEAADGDLVRAVHAAAAGTVYLSPELGARIATAPAVPEEPPDDLNGREREVLRLLALGHTNAEIGAQLFLSVRTIETHRTRVQHKLHLSTRSQLVRYALDRGLLAA